MKKRHFTFIELLAFIALATIVLGVCLPDCRPDRSKTPNNGVVIPANK